MATVPCFGYLHPTLKGNGDLPTNTRWGFDSPATQAAELTRQLVLSCADGTATNGHNTGHLLVEMPFLFIQKVVDDIEDNGVGDKTSYNTFQKTGITPIYFTVLDISQAHIPDS